jgi:putative DNA primase/helicase
MDKRSRGERLDIPRVASMALSAVDSVLARWVPGGKRKGLEYVALNPTRSDSSAGSFSINTHTGQWSDFATGDKGGDLVALVAYLERVGQAEACKRLAAFLSIDAAVQHAGAPLASSASSQRKASTRGAAYHAILPIPADTLAHRPVKHPKFGAPANSWEYRDADSAPLFYVCRWDHPGPDRNKEIRPLSFGDAGSGPRWEWRAVPSPRALYGLDSLAARPGVRVLLVEGEKAADAARELFPDDVVMTWAGGVKAIREADFSPLAGRSVLYWPDNDGPGRDSIAQLRDVLGGARVHSFDLVSIETFGRYQPHSSSPGDTSRESLLVSSGDEWPEKADAADAWSKGWTAAHIALLEERGELVARAAHKGGKEARGKRGGRPDDGNGSAPARFLLNDRGVFAFNGDGYFLLSAPLEVLARSRNTHGSQWGVLVRFCDHDGTAKEWAIPMALFSTDGGAEVIRGLLDRGLSIASARDAKRRLLEYLQASASDARVRLIDRIGWHGGAFMLPGRVIGEPLEPLHYYSDAPSLCRMDSSGTLAEWREHVAAWCVGNPLPCFAVSAAFAAPLLDILGSESFGIHFVGDSSLGKSTLLKLSGSVCGSPAHYLRTWRATDNALEATAAAYSDCVLILDEFGQCDPRVIGEVLYMLGNGQGKARANDRGGARDLQHSWRLVFLSSGERTLAQHMDEAKKKPAAGQELRFLAIPARVHDSEEQSRRLGIYHDVRTHAQGAALSDHLVAQAMKYHGTALPEFLTKLVASNRADLATWIMEKRRSFAAAHLSDSASGQAIRAAGKFALIGAAGELATRWGVTGWPKGEAWKAADYAYRAWLGFRGGEGNTEERAIIEHLRVHFELCGESHYSRWASEENASIDRHAPRTMERYGFVRDEEEFLAGGGRSTVAVYYVTPEAFRQHVCAGVDSIRAARCLAELGALRHEKGKLQGKARLPGYGGEAVGCYIIAADKLRGDA